LVTHGGKVDLVTIGARIKKLRGNALQEDLANYLNVSQGHLSKIERGKIAPSLEMLILLSEKFRKSVDWILLGEWN
jgi:transcriptional regulator with XRE-family HTH domain